jgi:hypothetical protein
MSKAALPIHLFMLLQTLGLLADRQTFECNPVLYEKQITWRAPRPGNPPMFLPEEIRRSVHTALTSPRPTKFDIFARPLILLAFSDRKPDNRLHPLRREITIFPHRFELFEPHLKKRLLEWRPNFHGRVTFVPENGRYSTVNKDVPGRIIELCRKLRISARLLPEAHYIVEANFAELIPKKPKKCPRPKSPMPEEPLVRPQRRAASAMRQDSSPTKSFLRENIALHFGNFPSQPVITSGRQSKEAELILLLDIREYGMAAVRRYVAETIRWAVEYPFLMIEFLTGPANQGPQRRTEVTKTIEGMQQTDGIVYVWEVPRHNQSLVSCRFQERIGGLL